MNNNSNVNFTGNPRKAIHHHHKVEKEKADEFLISSEKQIKNLPKKAVKPKKNQYKSKHRKTKRKQAQLFLLQTRRLEITII